MARRLRISGSQLSLIEAGKRQPSRRVIERLASVVGIPNALVVLLASDENDVRDESISSLAGSLLKLLIATDDKQRPLPLEE